MTATGELLAELGLEGGPGDPRALEDLILRFDARVPHEAVPDAPRDPERAAAEFLEAGAGTIGAERTALLAGLSRELGFTPRVVSGTRRTRAGEVPHAALLLELPGGAALCDPAFPLPGLVPAGASGLRSPWGELSLASGPDGHILTIDGRGRCTQALRLADAADGAAALAAVPPPSAGTLLKLFDDRVAWWSEGLLTVLDRWSRFTQPLSETGTLERLFGAAPEERAGRSDPARLSAYDRSPLPVEALRERIGTPEGLLALATPGLEIGALARTREGWSWTLEAAGRPPRTERVTRSREGLAVVSEPADGILAARRYEAEATPEGTRLVLRTELAAVPPRGLPEPVRKTLVFHCVSELLAWGRER